MNYINERNAGYKKKVKFLLPIQNKNLEEILDFFFIHVLACGTEIVRKNDMSEKERYSLQTLARINFLFDFKLQFTMIFFSGIKIIVL